MLDGVFQAAGKPTVGILEGMLLSFRKLGGIEAFNFIHLLSKRQLQLLLLQCLGSDA